MTTPKHTYRFTILTEDGDRLKVRTRAENLESAEMKICEHYGIEKKNLTLKSITK